MSAGSSPVTLASQLERDRLRSRAARLDLVVAALRARARTYEEPPEALARALADFKRERDVLRAQMRRGDRAGDAEREVRT